MNPEGHEIILDVTPPGSPRSGPGASRPSTSSMASSSASPYAPPPAAKRMRMTVVQDGDSFVVPPSLVVSSDRDKVWIDVGQLKHVTSTGEFCDLLASKFPEADMEFETVEGLVVSGMSIEDIRARFINIASDSRDLRKEVSLIARSRKLTETGAVTSMPESSSSSSKTSLSPARTASRMVSQKLTLSSQAIIRVGEGWAEVASTGEDPIAYVIGEIIDNAMSVKAKSVRVVFILNTKATEVEAIAVVDDGPGLTDATHDTMFNIGHRGTLAAVPTSTPTLFNATSSISKWGVGLKDAGFTLGNEIRVYSRNKEDYRKFGSDYYRRCFLHHDNLGEEASQAHQRIGSGVGFEDIDECDAVKQLVSQSISSCGTVVVIKGVASRLKSPVFDCLRKKIHAAVSGLSYEQRVASFETIVSDMSKTFALMYRHLLARPEEIGEFSTMIAKSMRMKFKEVSDVPLGDPPVFSVSCGVEYYHRVDRHWALSVSAIALPADPTDDLDLSKFPAPLVHVTDQGNALVLCYFPLVDGQSSVVHFEKAMGRKLVNNCLVYWCGRLLAAASIDWSSLDVRPLRSRQLVALYFLNDTVKPSMHKMNLSDSLSKIFEGSLSDLKGSLKAYMEDSSSRFDVVYQLKGAVAVPEHLKGISGVLYFRAVKLPKNRAGIYGETELFDGQFVKLMLKTAESVGGSLAHDHVFARVVGVWTKKSRGDDDVELPTSGDALLYPAVEVFIDFQLLKHRDHDALHYDKFTFGVPDTSFFSGMKAKMVSPAPSQVKISVFEHSRYRLSISECPRSVSAGQTAVISAKLQYRTLARSVILIDAANPFEEIFGSGLCEYHSQRQKGGRGAVVYCSGVFSWEVSPSSESFKDCKLASGRISIPGVLLQQSGVISLRFSLRTAMGFSQVLLIGSNGDEALSVTVHPGRLHRLVLDTASKPATRCGAEFSLPLIAQDQFGNRIQAPVLPDTLPTVSLSVPEHWQVRRSVVEFRRSNGMLFVVGNIDASFSGRKDPRPTSSLISGGNDEAIVSCPTLGLAVSIAVEASEPKRFFLPAELSAIILQAGEKMESFEFYSVDQNGNLCPPSGEFLEPYVSLLDEHHQQLGERVPCRILPQGLLYKCVPLSFTPTMIHRETRFVRVELSSNFEATVPAVVEKSDSVAWIDLGGFRIGLRDESPAPLDFKADVPLTDLNLRLLDEEEGEIQNLWNVTCKKLPVVLGKSGSQSGWLVKASSVRHLFIETGRVQDIMVDGESLLKLDDNGNCGSIEVIAHAEFILSKSGSPPVRVPFDIRIRPGDFCGLRLLAPASTKVVRICEDWNFRLSAIDRCGNLVERPAEFWASLSLPALSVRNLTEDSKPTLLTVSSTPSPALSPFSSVHAGSNDTYFNNTDHGYVEIISAGEIEVGCPVFPGLPRCPPIVLTLEPGSPYYLRVRSLFRGIYFIRDVIRQIELEVTDYDGNILRPSQYLNLIGSELKIAGRDGLLAGGARAKVFLSEASFLENRAVTKFLASVEPRSGLIIIKEVPVWFGPSARSSGKGTLVIEHPKGSSVCLEFWDEALELSCVGVVHPHEVFRISAELSSSPAPRTFIVDVAVQFSFHALREAENFEELRRRLLAVESGCLDAPPDLLQRCRHAFDITCPGKCTYEVMDKDSVLTNNALQVRLSVTVPGQQICRQLAIRWVEHGGLAHFNQGTAAGQFMMPVSENPPWWYPAKIDIPGLSESREPVTVSAGPSIQSPPVADRTSVVLVEPQPVALNAEAGESPSTTLVASSERPLSRLSSIHQNNGLQIAPTQQDLLPVMTAQQRSRTLKFGDVFKVSSSNSLIDRLIDLYFRTKLPFMTSPIAAFMEDHPLVLKAADRMPENTNVVKTQFPESFFCQDYLWLREPLSDLDAEALELLNTSAPIVTLIRGLLHNLAFFPTEKYLFEAFTAISVSDPTPYVFCCPAPASSDSKFLIGKVVHVNGVTESIGAIPAAVQGFSTLAGSATLASLRSPSSSGSAKTRRR